MRAAVRPSLILTTAFLIIMMAGCAAGNNSHRSNQLGHTYHWQEGDFKRTIELVRFDDPGTYQVPIFFDHSYGTEITLLGGVVALMEDGARADTLELALRESGIPGKYQEITGISGAYLIETASGPASIHAANRIAQATGIATATPNWRGNILTVNQEPRPYERRTTNNDPTPEPPEDLHGDTQEEATTLQVDERTHGTIAEGDVDYFKIVVPEGEAGYYSAWLTRDKTYKNGFYMNMVMVDPKGYCKEPPCWVYAFARTHKLSEETYIFKVSASREIDGPRPYSVLYRKNQEYEDGLKACSAIQTKYDDELYGCQWHLNNTRENGTYRTSGIVGADINVEAAWDAGVMGAGVNVQIVDGGLDSDHPDITANVNRRKNHNHLIGYTYLNQSNGEDVYYPLDNHGEIMTGLIAARDNDIGYRGVAPRATVYLHNALLTQSVIDIARTVGREINSTAVASNSYGLPTYGALKPLPAVWRKALDQGVSRGNKGKGISFIFSSAVKRRGSDGIDTNAVEITTHPGIIPVCGTGEYGTHLHSSGYGYSHWVCAPGGIHAPTKHGHYTVDSFSSVSGATAVAAGVAALVRSANTSLTWRDVKVILAQSAQFADPDHPDWETGAKHYRDPMHHYRYNPYYGFGVVDAGEAVRLAQHWQNLPRALFDSAASNQRINIRDREENSAPTIHTSTVDYEGKIDFTEYVGLHVNFDHEAVRDLRIELTSPSGAVSKIIQPFDTDKTTQFDGLYRFGTSRHLGENPQGTWTLTVSDETPEDSGVITGWSLEILGHKGTPLTAEFLTDNTPDNHNGQDAFTFELRFSEDPSLSYVTLRDHAFSITNATVSKARRLEPPSNLRWLITVQPTSDDPVTISLPATADCTSPGAICASNDRKLSSHVELTVDGPEHPNQHMTGSPSIGGMVRVGETLTVSTTGISDEDGLDNVTFAYQWIRVHPTQEVITSGYVVTSSLEVNIAGATGHTYTLGEIDKGKTMKILVSFQDDAGFLESATSPVTAVVEPKPNTQATGVPIIDGTTEVGHTLSVNTHGISDDNGMDDASFSYRWKRDHSAISGANSSAYTSTPSDGGHDITVTASFTDDDGYEENATSAPVSIPRPPLTAEIQTDVNGHDGQNPFTVTVTFSQNSAMNYTTIRDHLIDTTYGQVTKAQRVNPQGEERNRIWRITVEPDNTNDVVLSIKTTDDCSATGAVCTADGRKLQGGNTLTITGP